MFDRSLVTTGFDTEALVSEEYLTYLLLAQVEAGLLPLRFDTTNPESGQLVHVQVHPPTDYVRRYGHHPDAPAQPDPQHGSLGVRLLADGEAAFLFLLAWVTVEDDGSGQTFGPAPAGMFVDLELTATEREGFESRHQLRPSLVGLDPTTRAALDIAGVDADTVEAEIRGQLDRPIPLGVAQGQKVQRIRIKEFVSDEQRTLGIYVDLALRSGPEPESYAEPRGDLDTAQDFRPPGAPLAFATSPGLFTLLGQDAKFRQAEATDSGGFRYPLRENPLDPESNEVGRIKGISMGPEFVAGTALTTGPAGDRRARGSTPTPPAIPTSTSSCSSDPARRGRRGHLGPRRRRRPRAPRHHIAGRRGHRADPALRARARVGLDSDRRHPCRVWPY
jgi:hypothetical protein